MKQVMMKLGSLASEPMLTTTLSRRGEFIFLPLWAILTCCSFRKLGERGKLASCFCLLSHQLIRAGESTGRHGAMVWAGSGDELPP